MAEGDQHGGSLARVLRRDALATVLVAAATVCVQVGFYFVLAGAAVPQREAVMGSLLVAAGWVCLAAPAMAAGGSNRLSCLLRAGVVADASLALLVTLWLVNPLVSPLNVVQLYLTLAVLALAAGGAAALARSRGGRLTASVVMTLLLMLALTTPMWIGGLLTAAEHEQARQIAATAAYANPYYSISSALAERTQFVWHQAPFMYHSLTRLGEYVSPPPVPWWAAAAIYGSLAGVLWTLGAIARKR